MTVKVPPVLPPSLEELLVDERLDIAGMTSRGFPPPPVTRPCTMTKQSVCGDVHSTTPPWGPSMSTPPVSFGVAVHPGVLPH